MRGEICDCRRGAVRWSEWRCRLCRCLGSLVLRGEKSLQPSIVSSLFVRIEQAKAGYRNLIEELICKVGVFSLRALAQVRGPLFGSGVDHIGIGLKNIDPEQAIMVRRLVLGRNPKPFVIGIETACNWLHRRPRVSRTVGLQLDQKPTRLSTIQTSRPTNCG